MRKFFRFGFLVIVLFLTASGKQQEKGSVNWLTLEEAIKRSESEKRKFFIDVYTDWCGWCKVMDRNTFSDPKVAEVLNTEFYPVKFDAEQTGDITFQGRVFKFIPQGNKGTHELAAALLNNRLSYPTVVFTDENFSMIFPIPGYRDAPEFHKIMTFFSEDHFLKGKEAWNEFQKIYQSPYPAQAKPENQGK